MSDTGWYEAMDVITPYVVRISTPQASGTGFLFAYAAGGDLCAFATAAHVVNHAKAWEEPIRIYHLTSNRVLLTRSKDRFIRVDQALDTAAIVVHKGELPVPERLQPLIIEGKRLRVGVEVGWVGFPAMSPENLCLFSGRISCWLERDGAYLVDGVAINGVSGGPAFNLMSDGQIRIIGVVSSYIPNRATGEPLPGVSVVRDVSQLQELVKLFKSLEDAKKAEVPPESMEPSDPAAAAPSA
jgi:hypothetical protein